MWKDKGHNRQAEFIDNMEKELQVLEEGSEVNTYMKLLTTRLKEVLNWKTPG